MSDVQPRESGRFAPKAKPAEPAVAMTATAILDRVANRRGFLIEPACSLQELNQIINFHGRIGDENTAQWAANTRRLRHLKGWFLAIKNHPEGLHGDLWIAWLAWEPFMHGVKWANRGWFDKLDRQCLLKGIELNARREREQAPLRARQWQAQHHHAALLAVEEARKVLAEKEAELEKAEAALQTLEAAA